MSKQNVNSTDTGLKRLSVHFISKWTNPDATAVDAHDVVSDDIRKWVRTFKGTEAGKSIRSTPRNKLHSFTVTSVNRPDGCSPRNAMGEIIAGAVPQLSSHIDRAKSAWCTEHYALAMGTGMLQEFADRGFKPNDQQDYQDPVSLAMALEVENSCKKGPFDHSGPFTAIKTVDSILESGSRSLESSDEQDEWFALGALEVAKEYIGIVDRAYKPAATDYLSIVRTSHLKTSMRGAPCLKAGNAEVELGMVHWLKWVFESTPLECLKSPSDVVKRLSAVEFKHVAIKKDTYDTVKSSGMGPDGTKWTVIAVGQDPERYLRVIPTRLTVDELLADILAECDSKGYLLSEIFTPRMMWVFGLSRNQGAPFKLSYDWDATSVKIDERADDKYRFVQPIGCIVQAFMMLYGNDLVMCAPQAPGRVGLADPLTNTQRMRSFIAEKDADDCVAISVDLTGFDQNIDAKQINIMAAAYVDLYDDPRVRDTLAMIGPTMCQKALFMPTESNVRGKKYSSFYHYDVPWIKAHEAMNVNIRKQYEGATYSVADQSKDAFEYGATAFYIYNGFLTSGHYFTNTLGSDINKVMARYVVPRYVCRFYCQDHGLDEATMWPRFEVMSKRSLAAGDDTAICVPKWLYDELGLEAVIDLLRRAYEAGHWQINAKKLSRITYKGYPHLEFLQKHYPQNCDGEFFEYVKFMRQFPVLPWTERHSKLPLIVTYTSIGGRLDSCLNEMNVELAAGVFARACRIYSDYVRNKFKPDTFPRSPKLKEAPWMRDEWLGFNTQLLGLDAFANLVHQYGASWMSHVITATYNVFTDEETLQKSFDALCSELELRAPHKAVLAAQLASLFRRDVRSVNKYADEKYQFTSQIPRFVELVGQATGYQFSDVSDTRWDGDVRPNQPTDLVEVDDVEYDD